MHEIEVVAHVLEYLAAHQLLDGLRRLELAGSGGLPQERERERAADDGAYRRQLRGRGRPGVSRREMAPRTRSGTIREEASGVSRPATASSASTRTKGLPWLIAQT